MKVMDIREKKSDGQVAGCLGGWLTHTIGERRGRRGRTKKRVGWRDEGERRYEGIWNLGGDSQLLSHAKVNTWQPPTSCFLYSPEAAASSPHSMEGNTARCGNTMKAPPSVMPSRCHRRAKEVGSQYKLKLLVHDGFVPLVDANISKLKSLCLYSI